MAKWSWVIPKRAVPPSHNGGTFFIFIFDVILRDIMETSDEKPKVGIGVLIFKDGKILLGKRKNRHGDGEYSFTGGHLEYMQSFEDCAKQETLEESGIKIKNVKFLCLGNKNYYPPRHEVYIGVTADWEEGVPETFPDERIGDWNWYDLDNLPAPLFKFAQLSVDAYKSGTNYYDKN
jgi:8-oxo-dGTP diphosphatase